MVDELVLEPAAQPVALKPQTRVLVVDDDQDQLTVLSYRLDKLGFETETASSGQQALELAQTTNPDLVLLDVCLPDANGFEICKQLGDSQTTCGVPVIILSALDSTDVVRQARTAGSSYFLRKPYDPNVLLTLIQNALGGEDGQDW